MLWKLKKHNFQTIEKKNIYCLNLIKFKSYRLDTLSLKKKKSLLEFQLASILLKDQQFSIIENNIKPANTKNIKDCKTRKLVKSGILLSDHIIFNEKPKLKYILRLFTFSNFNSLNTFFWTISKQENSLPSVMKVNFLVFKKVEEFLLYVLNFGKIYIKLNSHLKFIS